MYGYIYKTTNLINGKIYIGQHHSETFDETYYGSGKYLRNALNKYGLNNFKVELMEWCSTKKLLDIQEIYWIAWYRNSDAKMYNIASGGEGGDVFSNLSEQDKLKRNEKLRKNGYFSNLTSEQKKLIQKKAWETRRKNGNDKFSDEYRRKLSDSHKGYVMTEEVRKKISEALSGERHPFYGTHRSEDTKKKISLKTKGRKVSDETRKKLRIANAGVNNGFYGKTHSDEFKKRLSEMNKQGLIGMKGKHLTDEQKKRHSDAMMGKNLGQKWMNDGIKTFRVKSDEVQSYVDKGYKLGRKLKGD